LQKLVEHILYLGQKENGSINGLVLNKVLVLAFRDYLHENGENEVVQNLYDHGFELWTYGLIHAESYYKYKKFGRFFIREKGVYHEELSDIDPYIYKWLEFSLSDMIAESQNYELWRMNIEKIKIGESISISLDFI